MRSEKEGEKRAKFDALQTVVVSSEEAKAIPKGSGYVQRVTEWLKQKDIVGEYQNSDTGWDIVFNNRSIRNVVKHDARDGKVALLEYAPDLIENGVYLETTAKKDGLDSHIFAAKATIDGKNTAISFVVREDGNGKRYYDHVLMDNENAEARTDSSLRALTTTDANLSENPSSIHSVARKHLGATHKIPQSPEKVNREPEKKSAEPETPPADADILDFDPELKAEVEALRAKSEQRLRDEETAATAAAEADMGAEALPETEKSEAPRRQRMGKDGIPVDESPEAKRAREDYAAKLEAEKADVAPPPPKTGNTYTKLDVEYKNKSPSGGRVYSAGGHNFLFKSTASDLSKGDVYQYAPVPDKPYAFKKGGLIADGVKNPKAVIAEWLNGKTNRGALRSLSVGEYGEKTDAEYFDALKSGDKEQAQRIIDEQAKKKGYSPELVSKMDHKAPNSKGADEATVSLATAMESGIVPDDYWTHPKYYQSDAEEMSSFFAVKSAINRYRETGKASMWMYRAIPKDVKDGKFRNGDWVTPSKNYAEGEGMSIPGGYRIISQRASLDNLWWDANSINEFGYDDSKSYAYSNTKNNRKLLDTEVRDYDGNVVPPSKRFNKRKAETFYSKGGYKETASKAEMYQRGMTREAAKNKLKGLLGEGGVAILNNDNDGETVRMNRSSIGKLVSGSAVKKSVDNGFTSEQHYAVAADIVDLFKGSLKVLSHSDRDGNQDIKIHRYAVPLHVGDDMAYITVKESRQHGKKMYSVERVETGKFVGMLENALEQGSPALFPSTRIFHKDNIAKLKAAVKGKDKNLSGPSAGAFSESPAAPDASGGRRPISPPAMVSIAKKLGVKMSVADDADKRLPPEANGAYLSDEYEGTEYILIRKSLAEKPEQYRKVIAHEIGHAVSAWADAHPNTEVAKAMAGARDAFAEMADIEKLYVEGYELSKKIRPFDETAATEEQIAYRQSPDEIFADFMAAYLTDPAMLKKEAPRSWAAFHAPGGAETRKAFSAAYDAVQDIYAKGPEAVDDMHYGAMTGGFAKSEEAIESAKEEMKSVEKKATSLLGMARDMYRLLVDRDSALSNLVKNVQSLGQKISGGENPYLAKRALKYVKSEQSAYATDVRNTMVNIFGRISEGDRAGLVNTRAIGTAEAQSALRALKRKAGAENYEAIEEAAKEIWKLRNEYIIPKIASSGMFSDAFMDKVVNNDKYATFDVLRETTKEHGDAAVTELTGLTAEKRRELHRLSRGAATPVGAHKQAGSFGDIRNAFYATVDNDIKMLAFVDRNSLTMKTVDLLTERKNTLGFTAERQAEDADRLDNTVYVLRDGRKEAWLVSPEIAASMKAPAQLNATLRGFDKVNNIVRDVITQKNPAFWIWNFQRDFRSFHRNIDGSWMRKAAYLAKALPEVYKYTTKGIMSGDIRDALKERAMLPSSAYSKENFFDMDNAFFNGLANLKGEAQKANYCRRMVDNALKALDTANDTLELMTKLAGYKLLKDNGGMSAEERAHINRTKIGTPDIYAGGEWTPVTNRLFLFSNVGLQGLRENLKAIRDNPWRAAFIAAYSSVLGSLWNVLAEEGKLSEIFGAAFGDDGEKFGEWLQSAYRRIPMFDRVYRGAMPLPIEIDGKPVYMIFPHSEIGMAMRGMTYNVIRSGVSAWDREWDEAANSVFQAFDSMTGDVPMTSDAGFHPAIKTAGAAMDFARGNNPYDSYRRRNVMNKYQFEDYTTIEKMGHMARWTWNNIGLSTVWRIPEDGVNFEDKNWFEKLLALPVVGNPISRIVRVGRDYEE